MDLALNPANEIPMMLLCIKSSKGMADLVLLTCLNTQCTHITTNRLTNNTYTFGPSLAFYKGIPMASFVSKVTL
jgi:hypothetical protein